MENAQKVVIEILKKIQESKGFREIEIDDKTDLRKDLGLDSFDLAELTVRIEDKFGVDILEDGVINRFGEIIQKLK